MSESLRPAVYTISNTVNGKRYIGKSIKGVGIRWETHKRNAQQGRLARFYSAIRKHGEENFHIAGCIELGEGFTAGKTAEQIDEALCALETIRIRIAGTNNPNKGYNMTEGGDGKIGCIPSSETRAKMGASHRGKKRSDAVKARMSAAQRGKKLSAEHKSKLSAAHLGKKPSAETLEKMSLVQQGKTLSAETRAKISAAKKNMSAETKAKIGAAKLGNTYCLGRKHTAESRAKMSAAAKARCAKTEVSVIESEGIERQTEKPSF